MHGEFVGNMPVTNCREASSTPLCDTCVCRQTTPRSCLRPNHKKVAKPPMYLPLYVKPGDVNEAEALIARFGREAGIEAAERAEASRNVGNHLHYCRWRQIERLVILLSLETTLGTIH
jgi:hypothetical protein